MSQFQKTNPSLFFSKQDLNDKRLGELSLSLDYSGSLCEMSKVLSQASLQTKDVFLAGYPDDEGIQLNGGRTGASQAPDTIRKYLYKMTPPYFSDQIQRIVDIGNLNQSPSLEKKHDIAKSFVLNCLQTGHPYIAMGGGHDYAYSDGAGFLESQSQNKKPLIINFDAHLDVRPLDRGLSSGTAFYRLIEKFGNNFDLAQIGIQSHCNSADHIRWVKSRGAKVLNLESILLNPQPLVTQIREFLGDWLYLRPTYVSIDIDGFSSAFAMGCSQAWATGFEPNTFYPLLLDLCEQLDVQVFGLYEVSPRLDKDDRTSKLAAQLIYHYLYPFSRSPS